MGLLAGIKNRIRHFIVQRASSGMIDIVEVRTKEIRLTSVITETDIRIQNSFFLPITILSIETDLFNRDGLKVGRMKYDHPKRIAGNSNTLLTTISEISIITSLFQALSTLLLQNISMQSVGTAKVKLLWWTFDIPVDDAFQIHPSKLKIVKDETEEEKIQRMQRSEEWKEKQKMLKEKRKEKRDERKENMLKEKHGENYIPKDHRKRSKEKEVEIDMMDEPALRENAPSEEEVAIVPDIVKNGNAEIEGQKEEPLS
jgi:hypothetical protein